MRDNTTDHADPGTLGDDSDDDKVLDAIITDRKEKMRSVMNSLIRKCQKTRTMEMIQRLRRLGRGVERLRSK